MTQEKKQEHLKQKKLDYYELDFDKIKTLEDVILVLKNLNIRVLKNSDSHHNLKNKIK